MSRPTTKISRRQYIDEMLAQNPETVFSGAEVSDAIEKTFGKRPSNAVTNQNLTALVAKGSVVKLYRGHYRSNVEVAS